LPQFRRGGRVFLQTLKRQGELVDLAKREPTTAPGRAYHADDVSIVASLALASGFMSVLVLTLYLNDTQVSGLYARPAALWGVCFVILFWITRMEWSRIADGWMTIRSSLRQRTGPPKSAAFCVPWPYTLQFRGTMMRKSATNILLPAVLMVLAALLSFLISGKLTQALIQPENFDIWFDSDAPRVFSNMTDASQGHGAMFKHPIFSILLFPPTYVLTLVLGDAVLAVRSVLALNAALAAFCLWLLFRRMGATALDSALVCLLFMSSAGFIFWFGVPETFPFGATTIIISLIAATMAAPRSTSEKIRMALLSAASFSMTITNWIAGLAATAASHRLLDSPLKNLKRWLHDYKALIADLKGPFVISAIALVILTAFALVQNVFFGEANLFFNVPALIGEKRFMGAYNDSGLLERLSTLWTGSIVAGDLKSWSSSEWLRSSGFNLDSLFPGSLLGLAAQILWVFLLGYAVVSVLRRRTSLPDVAFRAFVTSGVTLAAFTLIHLIYGELTFLYVAHFAPLLVVGICAMLIANPAPYLRVMVLVMICLATYHNLETLQTAQMGLQQIASKAM
jgi:hypothetical protein